MKVMVTGAAGFIGSVLVDRLLAEGHAVDAVDDLSSGTLANLADARALAGHLLTFHRLDVRSTDLVALVARRCPEVVYHLAERNSPADPVVEAEVGVVGSLRVLEAARLGGVRKVVFATSAAAIYGELGTRDLPVKESRAQRPTTPHGVAKRAVGDYLQVYRQTHDLEFTALALASVYGPRQRASSGAVVAVFADRLCRCQAASLHGDGRQTRDFVFVDDVVDALARAATKGSGLLLNVGTGVETSVGALYDLVAATAGVDAPPERTPARPGSLRRCVVNPQRAALHLGWASWTPLDEGVGATVAWHRSQVGSRR